MSKMREYEEVVELLKKHITVLIDNGLDTEDAFDMLERYNVNIYLLANSNEGEDNE